MLIYRVEHKDTGSGPYRHYPWDKSDERYIFQNKCNTYRSKNHPGPSEDFVGRIPNSSYQYAFKSFEDLTNWFTREI